MLILWILVGALCGWIAALLARTNTSFKLSFYLTVGIIGSLAGGLFAEAYGKHSIFFSPNSMFIAILTSGALLVAARFLLRRA